MIKLLLTLALFNPPPAHYHFHGWKIESPAWSSCGAAKRLLHERWHVVIDGENTKVNRVKWKIKACTDAECVLEHHAEPDAYMDMTMLITPPFAYVRLTGITEARKPCHDEVLLYGF